MKRRTFGQTIAAAILALTGRQGAKDVPMRNGAANWRDGFGEFDCDLARDLLIRAGVDSTTVESLGNEESLQIALEVAGDLLNETAPDRTWARDFFSLTKDHWVLTDEGWIPGEFNTWAHTGAEPMEVLMEVNAC